MLTLIALLLVSVVTDILLFVYAWHANSFLLWFVTLPMLALNGFFAWAIIDLLRGGD